MIKNYSKKMWFMLSRQNQRCGLCGEIMAVTESDGIFWDTIRNEKLDFCHDYPRTKKHIKVLPLFIDSIFNATIGHNSCNVKRLRLNYISGEYIEKKFLTDVQAVMFEMDMEKDIELRKMGNCED